MAWAITTKGFLTLPGAMWLEFNQKQARYPELGRWDLLSAGAWERKIADFRGCSEVWIVSGELDFSRSEDYPNDYPEHPSVTGVVAEDGDAVCHTVPVLEELATTISGHYGNSPVIKYRAVGADAVLSVL